jgi:hypothetical protein
MATCAEVWAVVPPTQERRSTLPRLVQSKSLRDSLSQLLNRHLLPLRLNINPFIPHQRRLYVTDQIAVSPVMHATDAVAEVR